jgi:hypothetical protein
LKDEIKNHFNIDKRGKKKIRNKKNMDQIGKKIIYNKLRWKDEIENK